MAARDESGFSGRRARSLKKNNRPQERNGAKDAEWEPEASLRVNRRRSMHRRLPESWPQRETKGAKTRISQGPASGPKPAIKEFIQGEGPKILDGTLKTCWKSKGYTGKKNAKIVEESDRHSNEGGWSPAKKPRNRLREAH